VPTNLVPSWRQYLAGHELGLAVFLGVGSRLALGAVHALLWELPTTVVAKGGGASVVNLDRKAFQLPVRCLAFVGAVRARRLVLTWRWVTEVDTCLPESFVEGHLP
jgi:hypothetical protein